MISLLAFLSLILTALLIVLELDLDVHTVVRPGEQTLLPLGLGGPFKVSRDLLDIVALWFLFEVVLEGRRHRGRSLVRLAASLAVDDGAVARHLDGRRRRAAAALGVVLVVAFLFDRVPVLKLLIQLRTVVGLPRGRSRRVGRSVGKVIRLGELVEFDDGGAGRPGCRRSLRRLGRGQAVGAIGDGAVGSSLLTDAALRRVAVLQGAGGRRRRGGGRRLRVAAASRRCRVRRHVGRRHQRVIAVGQAREIAARDLAAEKLLDHAARRRARDAVEELLDQPAGRHALIEVIGLLDHELGNRARHHARVEFLLQEALRPILEELQPRPLLRVPVTGVPLVIDLDHLLDLDQPVEIGDRVARVHRIIAEQIVANAIGVRARFAPPELIDRLQDVVLVRDPRRRLHRVLLHLRHSVSIYGARRCRSFYRSLSVTLAIRPAAASRTADDTVSPSLPGMMTSHVESRLRSVGTCNDHEDAPGLPSQTKRGLETFGKRRVRRATTIHARRTFPRDPLVSV